MTAAATGATTSARRPGELHWTIVPTFCSHSAEGPLASPISEGNTSTPALNSTLPSCYVVNVNGTGSTNSTLSSPGVPRPSLSLTNASLPSAWSGQTNATNTTIVWLNSTVFCVQPPATSTATPSTGLTPTSGSSPGAGHHALNISSTTLTKTSTVSTTSSPHPISPKSSGVLVTSSIRVAPVTPSSRLVNSSGPPATPESSSPTHAKSSSSSASSRTSSRSTVVKVNPPSPLVPAPAAHTPTRPSGSSPTAPRAPKLPNPVSPARPAVPSSASVKVSKRPSPVLPSESSPTASAAPELPNTVFPPSPTDPRAPQLPNDVPPLRPAVTSSASGAVSPVAPSPPASVTGFPTGLDTSGIAQRTHSTITSTVTDTPESTFSTPVSITETTDSHVTITAPPVITTTGLSTLSDGTVVTVTHVIANPPREGVSGSSNGDS